MPHYRRTHVRAHPCPRRTVVVEHRSQRVESERYRIDILTSIDHVSHLQVRHNVQAGRGEPATSPTRTRRVGAASACRRRLPRQRRIRTKSYAKAGSHAATDENANRHTQSSTSGKARARTGSTAVERNGRAVAGEHCVCPLVQGLVVHGRLVTYALVAGVDVERADEVGADAGQLPVR